MEEAWQELEKSLPDYPESENPKKYLEELSSYLVSRKL